MLNECPPLPLWTTSWLAGDTASPLLMFLSPGRSSTSSRLWACSVHLHSSSFKKSTLVRTVIIKKSTNSKCWRGCGEKETLLHCWWECKLAQPLWETYRSSEVPQKTKNIITIWSSNLIPGHMSMQNSNMKRYMYPYIHSSTIHSSQDTEAI